MGFTVRCPTAGRALGRVFACAALLLAGCAGEPKQGRRGSEAQQLRELNARYAESLSASEQTLHELRDEVDRLRSQREAAREETERMRASAAALKDSVTKLEAEKLALQAERDKSDKARQTAEEKLKEVQGTAAANVHELADLRQKAVEYEERIEGLRSNNASLRKEFSRLNRDLEKVRSELGTRDAVIQSMTQGNDGEKLLGQQLASLERENLTLRSRCEALISRLKEHGEDASDVLEESASADPAPGSGAGQHGIGALGDFATLLRQRFAAVLRGDSRWNGVDIALASAAGGVLVFLVGLVCLPLGWRRARRLRRELVALEWKVAAMSSSDRPERSPPSSPAARAERPTSATGSFVRRRGQFSPIISSQTVQRESAGEEGEEAFQSEAEQPVEIDPLAAEDDTEEVEEVTINLGRKSTEAPQPSDLVTEYQAQARTRVARRSSGPAETLARFASRDHAEDEDSGEDEFASTQVISSVGDLDAKDEATDLVGRAGDEDRSAGGRGGRPVRDDREFLSELKDLIGQKVDEIIR
jgi:predicted  nucleic acid-binding Zn-ribbon protein